MSTLAKIQLVIRPFIHHQHEAMEDGHVLPTWPGRKSAVQVSSSASPSQSLSAPSPIDPGDLTHIWRCMYITTYTNYDRYNSLLSVHFLSLQFNELTATGQYMFPYSVWKDARNM